MTSSTPAPGLEKPMNDDEIIASMGPYNYGWHDSDAAGETARRGLDEDVVRLSLIHISEPTRHFKRSRMPSSA